MKTLKQVIKECLQSSNEYARKNAEAALELQSENSELVVFDEEETIAQLEKILAMTPAQSKKAMKQTERAIAEVSLLLESIAFVEYNKN